MALFWNVLASSGVRRKYSQPVAWNVFVPLLSTTFMIPPPEWPYSALKEFAITLNSCTASTMGTYATLLRPICPLFEAPSSMNSEEESRPPLTDHCAIAPLSNGRCQMAAPLKVTPDIIAPSMNGLRAFKGSSETCWVFTTPPRFAVCVNTQQ